MITDKERLENMLSPKSCENCIKKVWNWRCYPGFNPDKPEEWGCWEYIRNIKGKAVKYRELKKPVKNCSNCKYKNEWKKLNCESSLFLSQCYGWRQE